VAPKGQIRDPNTLKAQYLEKNWSEVYHERHRDEIVSVKNVNKTLKVGARA